MRAEQLLKLRRLLEVARVGGRDTDEEVIEARCRAQSLEAIDAEVERQLDDLITRLWVIVIPAFQPVGVPAGSPDDGHAD